MVVLLLLSGVLSYPPIRTAQSLPGGIRSGQSDSSFTVAPEADTSVLEADQSGNYGMETGLQVDRSDGDDLSAEIYLRFTVPGFADPVWKAVLRLFVSNGSADGPALYGTSSNWSEESLTWNTRPSKTTAVVADLGRITAGSWVEYDVTALVAGAGTYDFVLATTSTDGTDFSSREAINRPQLVVTVAATLADLLFADEFDGTALDPARWHTCFWWASITCTIQSNNEMGCYTPSGASVADGVLRLRAERRDTACFDGTTYPFASGLAMTGGRKSEKPAGFLFTYGYATARIKIPRGKGLWPAFWLLPADCSMNPCQYTSRPEIDIMEVLGDAPDTLHMGYHYPDGDFSCRDYVAPLDLSLDFHVYAIEWTPGALIWYLDGAELCRYTDAATISASASYLLLNLAVGGDWPGAPDGSTAFPSEMVVDYVRVYRR
jgi:beta-glucanase (GH16 family)